MLEVKGDFHERLEVRGASGLLCGGRGWPPETFRAKEGDGEEFVHDGDESQCGLLAALVKASVEGG